jgi:hypothetical protein
MPISSMIARVAPCIVQRLSRSGLGAENEHGFVDRARLFLTLRHQGVNNGTGQFPDAQR